MDDLIKEIQPLKEQYLKDAVMYIQEMGFFDLLDFCVDHKCFDKETSDKLFDEIVEFDEKDKQYWEEDVEK